MTENLTPFVARPDQDASATIKGFVYQVDLTLLDWIRLPETAHLELEQGEDIAQVVGAWESAELTQIKARERNVTLRDGAVAKFLADSAHHRAIQTSSSITLRFTLLTTAAAGTEQGGHLPSDVTGIDAWERIRSRQLDPNTESTLLKGVQEILRSTAKPTKCDEDSWKAFQAVAADLSSLKELIWVTRLSSAAVPTDRVRPEILQALQETGRAHGPTEAEQQYAALFVHAFRLLTSVGLKRLDAEILRGSLTAELDVRQISILERAAKANPSIRAVFQGILDGLGRIEAGVREGRTAVSDLSARVEALSELLPASLKGSPAAEPPRAVSIGAVSSDRVGTLVGREHEMAALESHFSQQPATPCVVSGMGGVGKTRLAESFVVAHSRLFSGGQIRVVLDPTRPADPNHLLEALADQAGVKRGTGADPWKDLRSALCSPRRVVMIDNVDADDSASAVARAAGSLAGCSLLVTGRLRGLGSSRNWREVRLAPLSDEFASEQLRAELGPALSAAHSDHIRTLVGAVGFLPLGVHLLAGYLCNGASVAILLERLQSKGDLKALDPADPLYEDRVRAALNTTFNLSVDLLRADMCEEREADAALLVAGLYRLGYAPAAGVGASLGSAITNLSPQEFEEVIVRGQRLCLVESQRSQDRSRWLLHPLVAARFRQLAPGDGDAVAERVTTWILSHLWRPGFTDSRVRGQSWSELQWEHAALAEWLEMMTGGCTSQEAAFVIAIGMKYATANGPYAAWLRLAEVAAADANDSRRSDVLWTVANLASCAGRYDRAMQAAEEKAADDLKHGRRLEAALAKVVIADVAFARGDLATALRVRQEILPIFLESEDRRNHVAILGDIATIQLVRGELDAAERTLRDECLPSVQASSDEEGVAHTYSRLAQIESRRGNRPAALQMYETEVLPRYLKLGEVRDAMVTRTLIAQIRMEMGDLAAALKEFEQTLAYYESIDDRREVAVTHGNIATALARSGRLHEAIQRRITKEIPSHMARGAMHEVTTAVGRVADSMRELGLIEAEFKIRTQVVLPAHQATGNVQEVALALWKISETEWLRGQREAAVATLEKRAIPLLEGLQVPQLRAELHSALANMHIHAERWDDAARILDCEVIPALSRMSIPTALATAKSRRAMVVAGRGDVLAALEIMEKEVIPSLERAGATLHAAIEWGRTADLLERVGRGAEAIQIRLEREAPIYRTAGATRELALVHGKIAHVLARSRRFNEAIRLHTQDVLPVLERIGDRREVIVGKHNLASALFRRGQRGDREQATEMLDAAIREAEALELPEAIELRKTWEIEHLGLRESSRQA